MSDELAIAPASSAAKESAVGVVKAALACVPYVGGLLNEVLFDIRSRLKQERVNTLVQQVAAEIGRLGDAAVDRDYLASEEFSDHLEDLLGKAANTRSDEKRKRFATILVASIQGHRLPTLGGLYMQILHELEEDELLVFQV